MMYADPNLPNGNTYLEAESKRLKSDHACAIFTDGSTEDNPIIFATREFYNFTGYHEEDVIGKNGRFLQGKDTNTQTLAKVKRALKEHEAIDAEIIYYTSSGEPFLNKMKLRPMFGSDGQFRGFASYNRMYELPQTTRLDKVPGL